MEVVQTNASNQGGSAKTNTVGNGKDQTKPNVPSTPRRSGSAQRVSSKAGNQHKQARKPEAGKRRGATATSVEVRRDWHRSPTTTFLLGILLIGVLTYCAAVYAANHHELKSWMVAAGFGLGIVATYVLMDGEGND